jgi:hypothetical protein
MHSFYALLMSLMASVVLIAALPQGKAAAMEPVTQPITILVRDGAGNPMIGVAILIKIDAPPIFEDHDKCLTDQDGICTIHLLPNTYRIQFLYRSFIPVEEQAVFNLTVSPMDHIPYITFVVAKRGDQLVPTWDMSRDPEKPPEPFLSSLGSEAPLANLDFGPIDTGLPWASTPTEPSVVSDATPTAQVVVDEIGSHVAAAPATAIPVPTTVAGEAAAGSGLTLHWLFGLLFALLLVVMAILVVVVIATRPKKKEQ